jgi:hypothetical protein
VDVMDSILTSIKKLLGIDEEYEQFDVDIIIHINSVFTILKRLGVGPVEGFRITGKDEIWSDFLLEDDKHFDAVKTYVYQKVRLIFDPPDRSAVLEAFKAQIAEFEWTLNVEAESV